MYLEEKSMSIYENLLKRKTNLCLIGLGYVGLPIAAAFSKKVNTLGFDVNSNKINLYKQNIDPTNEIGSDGIKESCITFTSDEKDLKNISFYIVAVPTPINPDNSPDLNPVIGASKIVGRNLEKGAIIVYESTVYPGVTEEICIPILEKESGLKCGEDFKIAYSPERINPGDKEHRLTNIKKIVSGMDSETLEEVANIYSLVIEAGVYKAPSIKVAEAAKVIENSQRDINIAFMNELSIIFHKLGIDTKEVLNAAKTKWNFLNFYPGLVGGHCIGVDPYYLTYKAEQVGYHSQVILSGRRINDGMGKYIAESTVKEMIKNNLQISKSRVGIFGITFKENCPDVRNSKVFDIYKELKEYGITPLVWDPIADSNDVYRSYGIKLNELKELNDLDVLIIAVAHKNFIEMDLNELLKHLNTKNKCVIVDVKGILHNNDNRLKDFSYWRL